MERAITINPLVWKLRRIAAGLRQQDVASKAGISTTRYSAIERGELEPSSADVEYIERILPRLSSDVEQQIVSGGALMN